MTLTLIFAAAFLLTLVLLIRSLFRQAGVQDAIKQTAEQAADQLRLWEEFGEHLDEGLALVDPDGTIQYDNRAFAELTGWKGRSAKSQRLQAVLTVQSGTKRISPDEQRRKVTVRSSDGAETAVYVTKRKLHQPAGYEVVILVDATAEDAERALRRRLVNLSSFELRAPITAMKGYADLLLSGDAGKLDKEAQSKVKVILESADKLLRIIDDMAQVQVLSEAKSTAAKQRVKAATFAKTCTDSLRRITGESGRRYEFGAGGGDAEVEIAKADIERLLGMVANTAARTGKPDSVVTMQLVEGASEVDFRFENEGPPLARDQQKNVFDYVGAQGFDEGIGYYVAQQIISAHHGRFSVSQTKAGNAFVLSLPCAVRKAGSAKKSVPKKLDLSK